MTEGAAPWTAAEATRKINEYARDDPTIALTFHAKEQMWKRDLLIGDVLHLLRAGFVYDEPEPASRGYYKYCVEGATPNSGRRKVRLVVIPGGTHQLKIVTVMWKDKK